jgi:hypothetical protein
MDEPTYKQTENLPKLQDFFPYLGHCLASPHENQEKSGRNGPKIWMNSSTKNK